MVPGSDVQRISDILAQEGTDIAVRSAVAVVDVLGDTSREDDVVNLLPSVMPERRCDHELPGERGPWAVLDHLDKHSGHQSRAGLFLCFSYLLHETHLRAELV